MEGAREGLTGATVLITGGTGSFGDRVAQFLLEQGAAESESTHATRRSSGTCSVRCRSFDTSSETSGISVG